MGVVYLVGAGPGEAGFVTVRAHEVLAHADVVLYDDAISDGVLGLINEQAERIPVRGGAYERAEESEQMAALLAAAVRRAATVVRLYAGDPFLFASGAGEARALRAAGVSCEVVPGVAKALAAPSLAGIPVTRDGGTATVVLTDPDPGDPGAASARAWEAAAIGTGTLVIQTHSAALSGVVERLLRHGWPPDSELAVIVRPGAAAQESMTCPLVDAAERVGRSGWVGPLVAVVGATVDRGPVVDWQARRPLHGLRVVVTRARAQAADLSRAVEALGAEIIVFPTIRFEDPADPGPLREAARTVASYDWVIFTSANGVDRFWRELVTAGLDARAFGTVRVACIGPATAAALERRGIRADIVPPQSYVAESVLESLLGLGELRGARILLPRAAGARAVLPDGLSAGGAHVDEVEAYRAVPEDRGADGVRRRVEDGDVDVVTFTSSSTVQGWVRSIGAEVGRAIIATIGPITAQTARSAGLPVHVEADEHTVPGLVRALVGHFEGDRDRPVRDGRRAR